MLTTHKTLQTSFLSDITTHAHNTHTHSEREREWGMLRIVCTYRRSVRWGDDLVPSYQHLQSLRKDLELIDSVLLQVLLRNKQELLTSLLLLIIWGEATCLSNNNNNLLHSASWEGLPIPWTHYGVPSWRAPWTLQRASPWRRMQERFPSHQCPSEFPCTIPLWLPVSVLCLPKRKATDNAQQSQTPQNHIWLEIGETCITHNHELPFTKTTEGRTSQSRREGDDTNGLSTIAFPCGGGGPKAWIVSAFWRTCPLLFLSSWSGRSGSQGLLLFSGAPLYIWGWGISLAATWQRNWHALHWACLNLGLLSQGFFQTLLWLLLLNLGSFNCLVWVIGNWKKQTLGRGLVSS